MYNICYRIIKNILKRIKLPVTCSYSCTIFCKIHLLQFYARNIIFLYNVLWFRTNTFPDKKTFSLIFVLGLLDSNCKHVKWRRTACLNSYNRNENLYFCPYRISYKLHSETWIICTQELWSSQATYYPMSCILIKKNFLERTNTARDQNLYNCLNKDRNYKKKSELKSYQFHGVKNQLKHIFINDATKMI